MTPARLVDSLCPWFCTLDAPGLPSRVGHSLGMPFGLSTPGGQPVAVCWFPGPLLPGCVPTRYVQRNRVTLSLLFFDQRQPWNTRGSSPGISHFAGVSDSAAIPFVGAPEWPPAAERL